MHIRRNATIAVAIVLGAVAVLVVGSGVRSVLSARQTASVPAAISSAGRSALAHCRDNVAIIHDVHWAAACMANAKQEEAKRTECLREEAPSGAAATTS